MGAPRDMVSLKRGVPGCGLGSLLSQVPNAGPGAPGKFSALSFFGLAEFGDYGEVFEGGGVALDFAVGG